MTCKPMTARNPQANATIERVHQTPGDMLQTSQMGDWNDLDESDPWSGIPVAVSFAMQSTCHTTVQATPAQLVSGQDALLNIEFQADWNLIKKRKQQHMNKSNCKENSKRLAYKCKIGNKILIKNAQKGKCASNLCKEPCKITAVYDNGTVHYQHGAVTNTINTQQIKLYLEQNN